MGCRGGIKISKRVSGKNNPMYGKKLSAERIQQISEQTSRKRWVHTEHESLYVDIDFIDSYLNEGFELGRGWIGIWVNNGIEMKKINKNQLDNYISNGYSKGKMKKHEFLTSDNRKEVSQ